MRLAIGSDEGAGPLVVLLHGFPELPSCWRHQVGPLAAAGYRVVAPFMRGYGDSPAPPDPAAYTVDLLADDVAEVVEACGESSAVVVGHDWGGSVAWAVAQLRPDRVRGVMSLSTPFTAPSRKPPIERLREISGERFFYMLHFQEPGVAEAELSSDVRSFLLGIYASSSGSPPPGAMATLPAASARFVDQLVVPKRPPLWLHPAVVDEEVATFERTGFTGGLNYYRAMDLTWAKVPQLGDLPVRVPAAFLAGEFDLILAFTPTRAMGPPLVPDLRFDRRLPGIGHWVQQEAPEETTAAILEFLAGLAD